MTITRKYFESLLNQVKEICLSSDIGIVSYFSAINRLNNLLKEIKQYNLFSLQIEDAFFDLMENKTESEVSSNRIKVIKQISQALMSISFERDYFSKDEPDYFLNLQKSLIELPYLEFQEIYSDIFIDTNYLIQKHIHLFPEFKSINKEELFNIYKNKLKSDKNLISYTKSLTEIPKDKILKVTEFFKSKIENYRNYIYENYPSIKDEFKYFNNTTRIYFINYKDDGAHMRIYNYKKSFDEHKLYVNPYSLDFTPYEFENIELTEQNIVGGLATYVKLDRDFSEDSYRFFSEREIHHELVNIYIKNSTEEESNEFLKFLLKCRGYNLSFFNQKEDLRSDFTAKFNDETIHFIYLKGDLRNIENIKSKLSTFKENEKVTFITNYRINSELYKSIEKENIDIKSIYSLSIDYINNNNTILLHWYIQSKLENLKIDKSDIKLKSEELIENIKNCKYGLKGWSDYEKICEEIFSFLFKNYFRNYTTRNQSYAEDGIFRRDLIINNNYKDINSFWGDIKTDFNSNVIIVDFKNYENKLEQNELLIPTKYINLTTGNALIVVSRKGINENSKTLQKRFLKDGKLIISLDDNDIIEMIREKGLGNDVLYMLDNKKFLLYENE